MSYKHVIPSEPFMLSNNINANDLDSFSPPSNSQSNTTSGWLDTEPKSGSLSKDLFEAEFNGNPGSPPRSPSRGHRRGRSPPRGYNRSPRRGGRSPSPRNRSRSPGNRGRGFGNRSRERYGGYNREPRRHPDRSENGKSEPNESLAIFGLNNDINEDDLIDFFSQYGRVVSANIVTQIDHETRRPRSRGFGFVIMSSIDDSMKAIKANDEVLKGSALRVDFAKKRPARGEGRFNDRNRSRERDQPRYGRDRRDGSPGRGYNSRNERRHSPRFERGGREGSRDNYRGGFSKGGDRPRRGSRSPPRDHGYRRSPPRDSYRDRSPKRY